MKPLNLKTKLVLLISLLVFVPLFICNMVFISHMRQGIIEEKQEKLKNVVNLLSCGLENRTTKIFAGSDWEKLNREQKIALLNQQIQPALEKITVEDSGLAIGCYIRDLEAIVAQVPAGSLDKPLLDSLRLSSQAYSSEKPIYYQGQVVGYLVAVELRDNLNQQIWQAQGNALLVFILAVLLVFLAVIYLSNYLLDHVFRIEKLIAAGGESSGENFLHSLLDNIPIGVVAYSANKRISFVNKATEEILGYPKSELVGQSAEGIYEKILSPEDRLTSPLYDILEGKAPAVQKQMNYIARHGEKVPALVNIQQFFNSQELSVGALVMITDLRKDLRMEKLESIFSYVFDSMSMGAIILDDQQRVTHFNLYAQVVTGLDEKDVLGKKLLEVFGGSSWQDLFTALLKRWDKEFSTPNFRYTLAGENKSLLVDSYRLTDLRGGNTGAVILLKDVGDIQVIKDHVHKLEQEAQFILESIDVGVLAVNNQLMVTVYNKAAEQTLKVPREKVINQNINTVFPPEAEEHYFIQKTVLLGKEFNEIHIKKTLGEPGELIVSTRCLYDQKARTTGAVSVFKDITKMRRLEKEMQRTERLSIIGELAAGIAHEIKNPICVIKGLIEMMEDQKDQLPDPEDLQIIRQETERVEKIIQEYLQLAKPSEPLFSQVDLNQVVGDVQSLMKSFAKFNGVKIVTQLDPSLPKVQADILQLKQVLINITKNGIEAMNGSGSLEIITKVFQDQMVEINVKDKGCGMPQEVLENLGTPFLTTKEEGTGLGLMVSYKIIEKHHGKIRVTSQKGEGTEFTLLLPILKESA